ncbi:MAG: chemotaxis protein CheD [Oscillospiraceae bacterium]
MSNIIIGIADMKLGTTEDTLVTYALGSCVGIMLYDKTKKVGGLVHVLLPDSTTSTKTENPYKFADTGIEKTVLELEKRGINRVNLKAKIAGGAQMFKTSNMSSNLNIGERNVAATKVALQKLRIPIIAQDVGLDYGRTVKFDLADGSVTIKSIKSGDKVI